MVLVNDPLDTVEQVARAYDIRWLVLEPKDSVEAARDDPASTTSGRRGSGRRSSRRDDVAVYPVCLDAADTRCPTARASTGR